MGAIKGMVLDSKVKSIAKDLIDLENTGVAFNLNQTLANLNAKHKLVDPNTLSDLQNDVYLHIQLEKGKRLKSMSALGYGSYKTAQFVEKAKEFMNSSPEVTPETN